jgi:acyl dehydratase
MRASPRLLLEQVKVGERLPTLAHEVSATTVVLGALASRDWRPMHHDHAFAVNRNGVRDIFMNTPNQAAWFERYVTDWTGPFGRIGRMIFRMQDSVFPGDRMELNATVERVETDETGCGWVELDVRLSVGEALKTACAVRVALPRHAQDNPWKRSGEQWKPRPAAAGRPGA